MSFSDDVDLEAQIPYSDSPEFDRLAETVATGLFDINSNIVSLQRLLRTLNSKPDVATEERAVDVAESTRQKFKELSSSVRSMQTWTDCAASQKFTQQKLSREFSTALTEFQGIQRDLAQKQRSNIIQAKTDIASSQAHPDDIDGTNHHADGQDANPQHSLLEQQTATTLSQEEVDYQQQLIQERELEIQGIEHGIEELNEIFTDISTIVTEQGTIIGESTPSLSCEAGATGSGAEPQPPEAAPHLPPTPHH
ncbi:SNAP receptor PEP12 [Sugiyamaella lignohabitans]|uniref:SNAP receptor PEP12 n=1 Tax=Sugiyamaella lignohabitans TaxID=796027 RepID=A0A161HMR5_9ASCO|nr:SNAP receptor PEP12 [Sugiyamaella lignohabitans]ANB15177.1 SNAP receptor PEP12 [Sugiyamaella lignohabitans]